jgi:hypothetical protein
MSGVEREGGGILWSEETLRMVQMGGEKIDNQINKEEQLPEIWSSLVNNKVSTDYYGEASTFFKQSFVPLPQTLLQQFEFLQAKSFMGIFKEINRCWMTIDNQLFLWNYMDGSDFALYDSLSQIINTVGLVRVKQGVFIKEIDYLLVLCTPVEITLLAVQFPDNNLNAPIALIPSIHSIHSIHSTFTLQLLYMFIPSSPSLYIHSTFTLRSLYMFIPSIHAFHSLYNYRTCSLQVALPSTFTLHLLYIPSTITVHVCINGRVQLA